MGTSNRTWYALFSRAPYRVLLPALAGGIMLGTSLLPWLTDPLGLPFSAWQLPVDPGWQLRSNLFSYGLLCAGCALLAFFAAFKAWQSLKAATTSNSPASIDTRAALYCTLAGLLCLVLPALFLIQYVYSDLATVSQFSSHELQALLIRGHFGYGSSAQLFPITPLTFNPLTIQSRLAMLLDQLNEGLLLPLLSALLLLNSRRFFPRTAYLQSARQRKRSMLLLASLSLLAAIILGRGPAAMACNYQAEHLLSIGDYSGTLTWLDYAHTLNPSLDHLAAYNLERGQAWYYLHPEQPTVDSMAYLGSFYRQQNDFLSAYQEELTAWHKNTQALWLTDEINVTLQRLAEQPHPLNGAPNLRIANEEPSMTWLYQIVQADPTNVYAHYAIGRIQYDLHNYAACETQMLSVLKLSLDTDIQSSAYTYLGLSKAGEREYVTARNYLFKAQELDPAFRNNTAREEISGLR